MSKSGIFIKPYSGEFTYNYLIPGETNIINQLSTDKTTELGSLTQQVYLSNTEINTALTKTMNTYKAQYPNQHGIFIGEPRVPDETGYMKFRYQIFLETVETEMTCKFHLKADNRSTTIEQISEIFQHVGLPETIPSSGQTKFFVPYIGYRYNV